MDEKRLTFQITTEDGKKVDCEALCTFESEETGKNYIVYTDHTMDKEGNTRVYASIYTPGEVIQNLTPIETEKEWQLIERTFDQIMKSIFKDEQE